MYAIIITYRNAIKFEKEVPWDHFKSGIQKPFYSKFCLSSCVDMPLPSVHVFMISARQDTTLDSWNSTSQSNSIQTTLLKTLKLSQSYINQCQVDKWHNRLFFTYQQIFKQLLEDYPKDQGFIICEDDVLLLDATLLRKNVCVAQSYQFYSFYRTPSQNGSCLYEYGTQAFWIRRELMQQIIDVPKSTFCRLPIDIYISSLGPWYVTKDEVVRHIGIRTNLSHEAKKEKEVGQNGKTRRLGLRESTSS
jgi:hypothetical protein